MTRLALVMIARDEARAIARTLESARPFVDRMIVLDTGSVDATREIARGCGAEVHDFAWCDDFAAARNAALAHSDADWNLVLDADEWIEDGAEGALGPETLPPGEGGFLAIVLPLYHTIRTGRHTLTPTDIHFSVPLGNRSVAGRFWRTTLPDCDVPAYLVEQAELFERDDPHQGRGLYQYTGHDGRKVELVARAGEPPQAHALEAMVGLEVGKAHLDLLALVA